MSTKQTILGLVLSLLVGLAIGRYTLPAKIVETTKVVEVEKKDTKSQQQDNSTTTITQEKHPDGSVTTVTKIQKNVDTKTDTKLSDNKDSESSKETTYNTRNWGLNVIASTHPLSSLHPTVTYGGSVTYRLLGPITVGAMFLTDGTVGASLGISF